MAKFCSRRTFIDVDEGTANQFRRSKSCPEFGIRDRATPEEPLSGIEVAGAFCSKVDDPTQPMLEFLEPGSTIGSHGHPHICRRPCILFARGFGLSTLPFTTCGQSSQPRRAAAGHGRKMVLGAVARRRAGFAPSSAVAVALQTGSAHLRWSNVS
ncbi:unnamed protein product [Durusdinium trenchii]|uniref:Uncharacterized protein n=1 Tax=Durusdinium trenchii TaxID=1381693 RepID=A0ABP0PQP6_9DINO